MSAVIGTPSLSRRAQSRVLHELAPARYNIPGKRYDKHLNPNGIINMATAENSLMSTELLEYMHSHLLLTPDHLKYRVAITNGVVDSTEKALPLYINEYAHPVISVTPEHCVPGPGIGALFAQVIWALCNDGDGVLIATPYYSDYIRDIVYPAHAKQVPAPIPKDVDPLGLESIEHIRDAIRRSNAAGTTIRVLILCNPHNPLANAYPIDTVKAYAKTAQEFNLHLLVDEVYANQVFSSSFVPDPTPFVSVLSLDVRAECGCDPSRIHVLAGPTKDLGASGLKVGAFVSQHNPDLVQVVRGAIASIPISSASDALLTAVLRDDAFRIWFLEENRRRLSKAFENVAAWCLFHDIPFVPASAGVYVLADFATLMDKLVPTDMLVQDKLDAAVASMFQNGVFIRPTTTYGDPIPTRFRMTFTLPEDTMRLALHRLENAFNLTHWQDEKVI